MNKKIVVIGAGSSTFSLDILRDFYLTPSLFGSEIFLVDIDKGRLDAIKRVAESYESELRQGYRFKTSLDWSPLDENPDYVICAALAGGRNGYDMDRSLLEEHGYYRGIGMNTQFNQLKLIMDLGEAVKVCCPQTKVIMAANPVPEGCGLLRKMGIETTIGICHGHHEMKKMYSLIGITDYSLVQDTIAGINHNIWLIEFKYKGEDAYPLLRGWIDNISENFYSYYKPYAHHADYQISHVAIDLFKRYGLFPAGDTARGVLPEFWWYAVDAKTKERWFGPSQGFDGEAGNKANLDWLNNTVTKIDHFQDGQSAVDTFGLKHSDWDIIPYMSAITANKELRLQLSFSNEGAINGLEEDTIVEAPVIVDAEGLHRNNKIIIPNRVLFGALKPRELLAQRIINGVYDRDEALIMQTWLADWKTKEPGQAEAAWEALITSPSNKAMYSYYRGTQEEPSVQAWPVDWKRSETDSPELETNRSQLPISKQRYITNKNMGKER